jgi:hypothetical protein
LWQVGQSGNIEQGHEVIADACLACYQMGRVWGRGIELGWRLDGITGEFDHCAHCADNQSHQHVVGFQHHDSIVRIVVPRRMAEAQMEVSDRYDPAAQAEDANDPRRDFLDRRQLR